MPGTLLAGFIPTEVWRNSSQVKLLTLEEQRQIWTGPLVGTVYIWYWADPQLCCTCRQEASVGRVISFPYPLTLFVAGTFGAGAPKVRGFAKGQGRGWPWSKTPFLTARRPGLH